MSLAGGHGGEVREDSKPEMGALEVAQAVNSPAGVSLTRVVAVSQCSQEDFLGEMGSWSLGPCWG